MKPKKSFPKNVVFSYPYNQHRIKQKKTAFNLLERFAHAFSFHREGVAVYTALQMDFGHHFFGNLTLLDLNKNKKVRQVKNVTTIFL